ncbi:MAG: GTP-binding protein [Acidimicrobiales bacterium]
MIGFTSRSSTGVPQRVEALAEAVEMATDRLDEEQVAFGRHVVEKAGERLKHGTTHTLVALLGATGSGKSSVANALVGDMVATTGVRRPTTSSTLACFWGSEDAQPLLDWLEVKNRHHVTISSASGSAGNATADPGLEGLVLLDVPDHDSVADAHRVEMERIAEHADMLLWVTDPEKYADKAMHDYLQQLSGHGPVTAMVLNKSDQLDAQSVEQCRLDLKRLLDNAGLDEAPVVSISATTGDGVDVLEALLIDTVKGKQAMVDRLAADTSLAADALLDDLGPAQGATTVTDKVAKDLSRQLVDASGLSVVSDAVAAGYRRDAARKTGWPFTRWVRRLRPHPLGRFHLGKGSGGRASLPQPSGVQVARTASAVRNVSATITEGMPQPWPDLVAAAATPDPHVLNDQIDTAISESVREEHAEGRRWWNAVGFLQMLLAVAVVVGAVWLGLLAFAAYLQLPELPTPRTYWDIPIPTGLLVGGVLFGLLAAFLAARAAAVGAARRSRAVRQSAERSVREVSEELILEPIRVELNSRQELRRLLMSAKGQQ